MSDLSVEADETGQAAASLQASVRPASTALTFAIIAGAAFALYLISAIGLQARHATMHFGADSHLFAPLAEGTAYERVARFHPVTVLLASAWMAVLRPLTVWVSAPALLKAMFATVGALGVWAALAALAALVPTPPSSGLGRDLRRVPRHLVLLQHRGVQDRHRHALHRLHRSLREDA
jgi:hypothetical protein